jgi:hypothetical protein
MSDASARFLQEAGRPTYVTLLAAKRTEQERALTRYEAGLAQLGSSARAVAAMQEELLVRMLPFVPTHRQRTLCCIT